MPSITVVLRKEDIRPDRLRGKVVVVFDVLFATTTITYALTQGAERVYPCESLADARKLSRAFKNGRVAHRLAGEESMETPDDFQSPLPLTLYPAGAAATGAHHLVLATTNGTVALQRSRQAEHVYCASVRNSGATADRLVQRHPNASVLIVCAGSAGQPNLEDMFAAGYLANRLIKLEPTYELVDTTRIAMAVAKGLQREQALTSSRIGQRIAEAGYVSEVKFAAVANADPPAKLMTPPGEPHFVALAQR